MKIFGVTLDQVRSLLLADLQWYAVVEGTLNLQDYVEFQAEGREGVYLVGLSNILAVCRKC